MHQQQVIIFFLSLPITSCLRIYWQAHPKINHDLHQYLSKVVKIHPQIDENCCAMTPSPLLQGLYSYCVDGCWDPLTAHAVVVAANFETHF